MDRVKVASLLEEIILQMGDTRALLGEGAILLQRYERRNPEAAEFCDRFIHYSLRKEEFDATISALVTELKKS